MCYSEICWQMRLRHLNGKGAAMKSTTKIQLVIQQHLEEQLAGIYALDQQLDGINPSSDAELESLEAQLRESIRNQSLNLAKHIARNEVLTKELIRLEMEQEQLQQSNAQQQRVVALQVQFRLESTINL